MCCRYWADESPEIWAIANEMNRSSLVGKWKGRALVKTSGEIRPGDAAPVIAPNRAGERAVYPMKWGYTAKSLLINARAETALEKKTFADSLLKRRCIIPASGFYEWDAHKARYRFRNPNHGLLLLAGFYREEEDGPHFTILTTEASDQMRPVHDRMPVMLGPKEIHPWIFDESHLEEFLTRPQRNLLMDQDEGQISMF